MKYKEIGDELELLKQEHAGTDASIDAKVSSATLDVAALYDLKLADYDKLKESLTLEQERRQTVETELQELRIVATAANEKHATELASALAKYDEAFKEVERLQHELAGAGHWSVFNDDNGSGTGDDEDDGELKKMRRS